MSSTLGVDLVDLHCHLLWGIDDGAKTPDDSLAMARALVSLGFRTVAPSPHGRDDFPSRDAELCRRRLEEARELFAREDVPLTLHTNTENLLDLELPRKLERERRLVGEGPYLLAEPPYFTSIPQLPELIFRLHVQGVRLIVAHPERCKEFDRKRRAEEVVNAGALLQLDIGALTGRYGRPARKLARSLLEEGLYAVAATDLHSPRDAAKWVGDAIGELRRIVGDDQARRLLSTNPQAILAGEPVA